uniref:Uncharacterized protein n=1 Tax=Brugia timori TaxID=42155 RepID=A0A0R3QCT7_9BILA
LVLSQHHETGPQHPGFHHQISVPQCPESRFSQRK